jgi:ATP-dependent Zn protease
MKAPLAGRFKPTAHTWQAYQGLRFGAAKGGDGFDLQQFLKKQLSSSMEDIWNLSLESAQGKEVTPEDFILVMIKDFQKDLAEYQASEDKPNYLSFSYFGKRLGLSNSRTFVEDKAKEIDLLQKAADQLEAHVQQQAVEPDLRSHQVGDRLKKYFQASKSVLDTILVQAPDKLQTALVTEDMMLQLVVRQDRDLAGNTVRQLLEDLRLKPTLPVEDFLSEAGQTEDVVAADARKPVALDSVVNKESFKPYPGIAEDVREALQVLERNRSRHLLLQIPRNVNPDSVVDALAHGLKSRQASGEGAAPALFRIDAMKFFEEEASAAKGLEKLSEELKELVREQGSVVVHLQKIEPLLRRIQPDFIPNFFNNVLGQKGKVQFVLTPPESQLNPMQGNPMQAPELPIQQLLSGFSNVTVEVPKAAEVVAFLQEVSLPKLEKQFPKVTFPQEAVQKAVEMALLTRDELTETAYEYLATAAQRLSEGSLSAEYLSRVVREDPHLQYTAKSSSSGSYQRLGETELAALLEDTPDIIGADAAKEFFGRLTEGIRQPEKFKQFNLTPVTRAILVGKSGTAKTNLALQFAKENKVPLVQISGDRVGHLPPQQILNVVQQAFLSAKNESKRRESRGESPYVMVLVDNLEAAARPAKGMGQGVDNPLLPPLLSELGKLKEEENPHVIALGIANASHGLHPAFQSPVYVDEMVQVEHPTLQEREAIMKALATQSEAKLKQSFYAADLDYNKAARRLSGVTGKVLSVVLDKAREQAMLDPKNASNLVQNKHLDEAITILTLGTENRKLYNILSPDDRRATAYHEGGHALAFQKMKEYLNQSALELLKVTIMPQGPALGVTFYVPETDSHTQTKTQLFAQLVSVVASHPAEQLSLHDMTTGNSSDRQHATQIAATMINQVAMGKNRLVYPVKSLEDLAALPQEVRDEMNFLVQRAEQVADVIVRGYAPFMEELVDCLAGPEGEGGEETIDADQFKAMLAKFEAAHSKTVRSVERTVTNLMRPVIPERYPQGRFQRFLEQWFGISSKPVFREVERLQQNRSKSN